MQQSSEPSKTKGLLSQHSPRAERPDYEHRTGQKWRETIPYVMNYGHLSPEEYQREVEAARLAHWDRQMEVQRQQDAEREREWSMRQTFVVGKLDSRQKVNLELFHKFMEHFEPMTRKLHHLNLRLQQLQHKHNDLHHLVQPQLNLHKLFIQT